MGVNDRGFDPDDIDVNLVGYNDLSQDFHDQEELEGKDVDDVQWDFIDWATVEVVYPDGHREWVHIVGPWEDLDHFYDEVLDWMESGS